MDIKLTYRDRSQDPHNSDILIFQRNEAPGFESITVAWKVIKNCGRDCYHPFVYPMGMSISARDSWGNFTEQMTATNGQLYQVTSNPSGHELTHKGESSQSKEIQVKNALQKGSITACVYKDGRLLATKEGVAPNQLAVFQFKPTIWVGLANQIQEGQTINSAVLSSNFTELSLFGLASADIVMTGGGTGPDATSYQFKLENVTRV